MRMRQVDPNGLTLPSNDAIIITVKVFFKMFLTPGVNLGRQPFYVTLVRCLDYAHFKYRFHSAKINKINLKYLQFRSQPFRGCQL